MISTAPFNGFLLVAEEEDALAAAAAAVEAVLDLDDDDFDAVAELIVICMSIFYKLKCRKSGDSFLT